MSDYNPVILEHALDGTYAHVTPQAAFDGLNIELAGRKINGCLHTIWQLLNHMIYWQDIFIAKVLGKEELKHDTASEGWTVSESPKDAIELNETLRRFFDGIEYAKMLAKAGSTTLEIEITAKGPVNGYDALHSMALHNSYHIGEIVMIRRMLNSWPPPAGGMTW
jgi:uncharacterized damage-inducible protein DinB